MRHVKKTDKQRDEDFISFMDKLNMIAYLKPRHEYLYPLMASVPYQDTENAMDMIIINFGEAVDKTLKAQGSSLRQEVKKSRKSA